MKNGFFLHTPCLIDLQISTKLGSSFPFSKKFWPFFPSYLVNPINKSFLLNLLSFLLNLLTFILSLLFILNLLSIFLEFVVEKFP